MTNDLKNFLEVEKDDFVSGNTELFHWLEQHNDRLINFVLDLVGKEVEKQRVDYRSEYKDMDEIMKCIKQTEERTNNFLIDDISTIINNLRTEDHPFNELHITNCEECRKKGK